MDSKKSEAYRQKLNLLLELVRQIPNGNQRVLAHAQKKYKRNNQGIGEFTFEMIEFYLNFTSAYIGKEKAQRREQTKRENKPSFKLGDSV